MKQVINRKVYDTETAEFLAEYDNGLSRSDFRVLSESLYKTKKGVYFLEGTDGAMTEYAETCGNMTSGSSKITPLTPNEAIDWCEQHRMTDVLKKEFSDVLEEA